MSFNSLVFFLAVICTISSIPDDQIGSTIGAIWPKPRQQTLFDTFYIIWPHNFHIRALGTSCDLVDRAIERYYKTIVNPSIPVVEKQISVLKKIMLDSRWIDEYQPNENTYKGVLRHLNIFLNGSCETKPELFMDESYTLNVNNGLACVTANTSWGILRGLESFSQLVTTYKDTIPAFRINETEIWDAPRYPYRGIKIDTTRQHVPSFKMQQLFDGMSYNKLNVLHWRINFLETTVTHKINYYIALMEAFNRTADINMDQWQKQNDDELNKLKKYYKQLMHYASDRGILIIPEYAPSMRFRDFGVSFPGIFMTLCNESNQTDNEVESQLKHLIELIKIFGNNHVYMQLDDIILLDWETNDIVKKKMNECKLQSLNELSTLYHQEVINKIRHLNIEPIVWQDMYTTNKLESNSIVAVWYGNTKRLIPSVVEAGYRTIDSSCWCTDISPTANDWNDFYRCDPRTYVNSTDHKTMIIGSEISMWREIIFYRFIILKIFPRASVAADILWSDGITSTNGFDNDYKARLEEQVQRMRIRGINSYNANGDKKYIFIKQFDIVE